MPPRAPNPQPPPGHGQPGAPAAPLLGDEEPPELPIESYPVGNEPDSPWANIVARIRDYEPHYEYQVYPGDFAALDWLFNPEAGFCLRVMTHVNHLANPMAKVPGDHARTDSYGSAIRVTDTHAKDPDMVICFRTHDKRHWVPLLPGDIKAHWDHYEEDVSQVGGYTSRLFTKDTRTVNGWRRDFPNLKRRGLLLVRGDGELYTWNGATFGIIEGNIWNPDSPLFRALWRIRTQAMVLMHRDPAPPPRLAIPRQLLDPLQLGWLLDIIKGMDNDAESPEGSFYTGWYHCFARFFPTETRCLVKPQGLLQLPAQKNPLGHAVKDSNGGLVFPKKHKLVDFIFVRFLELEDTLPKDQIIVACEIKKFEHNPSEALKKELKDQITEVLTVIFESTGEAHMGLVGIGNHAWLVPVEVKDESLQVNFPPLTFATSHKIWDPTAPFWNTIRDRCAPGYNQDNERQAFAGGL